MNKLLFIKRKDESDWISCQSITNNLLSSYKKAFGQSELIELYLEQDFTKYDTWLLAKEIVDIDPDYIVFIDHKPHPSILIQSLTRLSTKKYQYIFHIFGDFTLYTQEWLSLESILDKNPPIFITASLSQKQLLTKLINSNNSIFHIPFPIKTEVFSNSLIEKSDEVSFLYTGRISSQKNVDYLISTFDFFQKNIFSKCTLTIAGGFDDLGAPFIGKEILPGSFGPFIMNLIKKCQNDNIKYIGNKTATELNLLYNQSDYYISLSSHNDEDYGMSPAEALCCGLPCLLSQWGGFNSFKDFFPSSVTLLPISKNKDRHLPDKKVLIKALSELCLSRPTQDLKTCLSKEASNILSIHSVSEKLKNLIAANTSKKFIGFTEELRKLASSHALHKESPFFRSPSSGYNQFFYELYSSYFGEDHEY